MDTQKLENELSQILSEIIESEAWIDKAIMHVHADIPIHTLLDKIVFSPFENHLDFL